LCAILAATLTNSLLGKPADDMDGFYQSAQTVQSSPIPGGPQVVQ
jgi:hypothetical protein